MKIDVLLSCMGQADAGLVDRIGISGSCVVVNQCDQENERTIGGRIRWVNSFERGLSRSRNRAIAASRAEVCLLCDDDEVLAADYPARIFRAYASCPNADVIIFKVAGWDAPQGDRVMRLRFPRTMHVGSWQISFRRCSLLAAGIRFDEKLGAGTGNGAEEELKFLLDCQRSGLRIYYVPVEIARVHHGPSTWFHGFTPRFFYNRGATTRYILGLLPAAVYGVYYAVKKRPMYCEEIAFRQALRETFRGILRNPISRQKGTENNENTVADCSGL